MLANPERRRRYDRDVLRVHQQQHLHNSRTAAADGGRTGSYAGSRPASGLSKRRGTFRGPPPSFYAHGGKDPAQHPNTAAAGGFAGAGAGSSTTTTTGGPSFGADFNSPPNTDFNAQPIHRTQTHEDTRRQTRREAAMAEAQKQMEEDEGFWVRFVVVTGCLVAGVSVAGLLLGVGNSSMRKGGMVRGDGSRRDKDANEWARGGGGGEGAVAKITSKITNA